jgi:hypothetical protein
MENLATALNQLRAQRRQSQQQLETLDQAIAALDRLARNGSAGRSNHPKRTLSAAARRRISQAQKARWARVRAKQAKAAA